MSYLLVAAVLASSSAAPAPTPSIYAAAGCYAVNVGPWQPAVALGPYARERIPPSYVYLTSRPGIGVWAQSHFMVVPALGATSQHQSMYWGVTPDGEVGIILENAVFGLAFSLQPSGSKLTGTARTFWRGPGSLSPEQIAPAMLSRVSCIPVA